jgi:hypothetical protein
MVTFQESGLTWVFPDKECFQMADLSTYTKIKGHNLKEMDFTWWTSQDSKLNLIELKDFTQLSHPRAKNPPEPKDFLDSFIKKATDHLLMLNALWLKTDLGKDLLNDITPLCPQFPDEITKIKRMKFYFIVKDSSNDAAIKHEPLQTEIRNKLRARMQLFGINHLQDIYLLDHQTAKNKGFPLSEPN